MLKGILTALITPFRDGAIDVPALHGLIEWQLREGVHGLVICGTTGEAANLTDAERRLVIETSVRQVAGRVPVIVGAGSASTASAIDQTRFAKEIGADAALVVTPYYNRPDQDGLYAHFAAIADAVQLPILLYNVPKRTGVDLGHSVTVRLAALPNVIGLKDATGDLARVALLRAACGEDFLLLSGDDASQLGFVAHGGQGCISVTANVAPRACAELQEAALKGDFAGARGLDARLALLHQALFSTPSPGPAKFACAQLGLCQSDVRLPLLPAPAPVQAEILAAMRVAGLIAC